MAVGSSAGKKVSSASSDNVTSTGVPNTVTVEISDSTVVGVRSISGMATPPKVSAAMSAVAHSGPLSAQFELPQPLLLAAGLVLLPWAALLAWLSAKPALPAASVWAVIGINLLWVIESAALLLLGWVQPNMLGTAFVIAQAVVVVIFAELQFLALRPARQGGLASA